MEKIKVQSNERQNIVGKPTNHTLTQHVAYKWKFVGRRKDVPNSVFYFIYFPFAFGNMKEPRKMAKICDLHDIHIDFF